ncbi:hypothetical protein SH668x_003280 [Planctomicrobium sp. SH668]|uniref:tetratricopeptide repeat protein n=1 Tax=Planctomicrobium sp. SH668 TaxID=3448126 RepID=UPI003F5B3FCE
MAGTTPEVPDNEHFHHSQAPTALQQGLNEGMAKAAPYTKQILIGCLAVVIAFVGYYIWTNAAQSRKTAGWDKFAECRAPEDYLAVADQYPNNPVGQFARLEGARRFLAEGVNQAMRNRELSDASLNKAKENFNALLEKKSVMSEVRQEALYGMATSLELLSDGDNKPAINAYEALLSEFSDSPHRLWAEERLAALKTPDSESFYSWFRKQNPKPADRPLPNDNKPSSPLDVLMPDLEIPKETPAVETPATQTPEPAEGEAAPEMPADPAAPPAPSEEKPAEMPAPEAPAAETTPAPETSEPEAPAPEVTPEPAPQSEPTPETPEPAPASN